MSGKANSKAQDTQSRFSAPICRPAAPGAGAPWAFVILPAEASAKLPRRGRITVHGSINGAPFTALLEPDGRKSHWLRVDTALLQAAGAGIGETANFEIAAVEPEPEPAVPGDFRAALDAHPAAKKTWDATTTIARLDWVHWIESAKQEKTRKKRIVDACDMLASGKKRVCCFDPSGYYSKAFGAPQAAGRQDR